MSARGPRGLQPACSLPLDPPGPCPQGEQASPAWPPLPRSHCPCCHAHTAPAGRREWLRFQEAEYKFFEHHSTWAQAQRICTWFQAELASVHSQAELDFLGHNLQKVSTPVGMGLRAVGGQAGEGEVLPTLICLTGFPSCPGAKSSTGGLACTLQRVMGVSGRSLPGSAGVGGSGCLDGQP